MTPPQTGLFLSAWCRCRVGQTQEYFRCADSHLDSLMTTKNVLLHNVYILNYQHYVLNSQSHGTVATSRDGYKNLRESPDTKIPTFWDKNPVQSRVSSTNSGIRTRNGTEICGTKFRGTVPSRSVSCSSLVPPRSDPYPCL